MSEGLGLELRRRLGGFAGRVDLDRVRLHRGAGGRLARAVRRAVLAASGGRAVTLGNHVFLPDRAAHDLPVLAHELTHCSQYQHWGALRYFARGAREQLAELLHRKTGRGTSPYRYALDGRPFDEYGMEQQGQIVEDAFRGHAPAIAACPYVARGGPQNA